MKHFFSVFVFIVFCLFQPVRATEIYVSPEGNDSFSGTKEKPFATLQRAQQAVRELKAKGPLVDPVFVTLERGTYYLTEPLRFTNLDSGTKECPITWQGKAGANPIISGCRFVGPWTRYNNQLYVTDIPFATDNYFPGDFFVNGVRAHLARTPNFGSYFYTKRHNVLPEPGSPCTGFKYDSKDIGDWINAPSLRIKLYQYWSNSLNKIKSINRETDEISFERALGRYLPAQTTRYYAVNFFEGLDSPGEWFYDHTKAKLFYYPRTGEDMSKSETIAACVVTSLVEIQGDYVSNKPVSHLVFKGISFENTRPDFTDDYPHSVQGANTQKGAFFAIGMEDCLIEDCVFARLGEHGITLWDGCHRNMIRHNHLYDLGGGGIYLSEATPKSNDDACLTSYNTVDNNIIHDGGYHYAAACGVFMAGSACYNKILHNEICNFYYTGIHAGWSWSGTDKAYTHHNEFAYNHVHHLGGGVMSDLGGVYFLGISTGTNFHDNHLHDIWRYRRGPDGYGGWGIYFDAGSSDIIIRNNIVHDTYDGSLHLHSYAYPWGDIIENNIFAFSENGELMRNADMESKKGRHATLSKNIIYASSPKLYYGGNWKKGSNFSTDYNCLWSTSDKPMLLGGRTLQVWQKDGNDTHSIVKDPCFIDADKRDFRLKKNSPVFELGFKPIDTTQIGLYGDSRWINLAKSIKPRPVEIAPPPIFEKITDNYETYKTGDHVDNAFIYEENKTAVIRVVDKEGINGSKCLKFIDEPGQKWQHDPHLAYMQNYPDGNIVSTFKLRFESGAKLQYQWRDYEDSTYSDGPTFNVSAEGHLSIGDKKLVELPLDQWVGFEVNCTTGPKANGFWTLKIIVEGKPVQTFDHLPYNKNFKKLSWVGYISMANDNTVFYLDDFEIDLKKK